MGNWMSGLRVADYVFGSCGKIIPKINEMSSSSLENLRGCGEFLVKLLIMQGKRQSSLEFRRTHFRSINLLSTDIIIHCLLESIAADV